MANLAKAGINISLKIETQTQYYGKSTVGNSDWLDGTMSLVDYGSRGVPNVFLIASTLTSKGTWNAARFKNPTYDKLVKQYVAAIDLQTQKQIAGKIQTLLLQETPVVIPYFIDGLTATKSNVQGVNPTSISQIYLDKAYIVVRASAGRPSVARPRREPSRNMARFISKRARARADHAADPQRDRVHPGQPAPGRSGSLHARPARPRERGQGAGPPVRHRQAPPHPVLAVHQPFRAGRHGHVQHLPRGGRGRCCSPRSGTRSSWRCWRS